VRSRITTLFAARTTGPAQLPVYPRVLLPDATRRGSRLCVALLRETTTLFARRVPVGLVYAAQLLGRRVTIEFSIEVEIAEHLLAILTLTAVKVLKVACAAPSFTGCPLETLSWQTCHGRPLGLTAEILRVVRAATELLVLGAGCTLPVAAAIGV
jgi:hypothetical protein